MKIFTDKMKHRNATLSKQFSHYTTDEPTIYSTRGEHANYYTTDAVPTVLRKKNQTNKQKREYVY